MIVDVGAAAVVATGGLATGAFTSANPVVAGTALAGAAAINPIRDTLFYNNPDMYYLAETIVTMGAAQGTQMINQNNACYSASVGKQSQSTPTTTTVSSINHEETSSKTTELATYYPRNNGAIVGTEKQVYLMPGDQIDRYGGIKGNYFSPTGTPMEMRALPGNADLSQYRQFEVVKPFEVESATISPAFRKIGLGTQYRSPVSADILLKRGVIKQVGGN